MTKQEQTSLALVGAGVLVFLLFFTNTGRRAVNYVTQSTPLAMNFGGEYVPGDYALDYTPSSVNGVSTIPGITNVDKKDGNCCCGDSGKAVRAAAPSAAPVFVQYNSPSVAAPIPLGKSSYVPPQEPDYEAYLRKYPDLMAFVQGNHLQQPHWTRGQGLREADYDGSGRVSPVEFARWFWDNGGRLRGDVLPMKNVGTTGSPLLPYM